MRVPSPDRWQASGTTSWLARNPCLSLPYSMNAASRLGSMLATTPR